MRQQNHQGMCVCIAYPHVCTPYRSRLVQLSCPFLSFVLVLRLIHQLGLHSFGMYREQQQLQLETGAKEAKENLPLLIF